VGTSFVHQLVRFIVKGGQAALSYLRRLFPESCWEKALHFAAASDGGASNEPATSF